MTVADGEWLVTAGDGSFAMGTTRGLRTRRYHGVLMHATQPPAVRRMLVTEASEQVHGDGGWVDLGVRAWESGATCPTGDAWLESFSIEAGIPTWVYRLPAGPLVRRVYMEREAGVTQLTWTWGGAAPVALRVAVLSVERDAHGSMRAGARAPTFLLARGGANVVWPAGDGIERAVTLHLRCAGARVSPGTGWWMSQFLAEEAARGYGSNEDVYHAADVDLTLQPGAPTMLALGACEPARLDPVESEAMQRERARTLASALTTIQDPALREPLAVAADQFVTRRPGTATTRPNPALVSDGYTIMAGYPWFADWGRDTMLSIRGLLLLTGRVSIAERLLSTWASLLRDGTLPNRLPDRPGASVETNSADAPLLFVRAIGQLEHHGGSDERLRALMDSVRQVIDAYQDGLSIGVRTDPTDGLVHASADGLQLTWMDAKCGEWVVTPRRGKPIELAALWYRSLVVAGRLECRFGSTSRAESMTRLAAVTRLGMARFWDSRERRLADVLDGPDGNDWSMRPNQLFALAELDPELLPMDVRACALEALCHALLVGVAVRTLAPDDPRFVGRYEGDVRSRDAAYHNGTAWPFLLGPLAEALHGVTEADWVRSARRLLSRGLQSHLGRAGIGSISEIVDGDAPHTARGCPMQAWSVAAAIECLSDRTINPG